MDTTVPQPAALAPPAPQWAAPQLAAPGRRAGPTHWPLWLAVCLVLALLQALLADYRFGVGNQSIQIPLLQQTLDPALFPHDAMLHATDGHYPTVFFQLLAPLCRHNIPQVYAAGHLVISFIILLSAFALAEAMFADAWAGLLLMLLLLAGHHRALAGEELYSLGFTHTYAALACALAALALLYRRQRVLAYVLTGLLFNLHALTAAYLAAMLVVSLAFEARALGWKKTALLLACLLIPALPTLVPLLYDLQRADPDWFRLTFLRSADHSFPSTWWEPGRVDAVLRFALICGLAALAMTLTAAAQTRKTLLLAATVAGLFAAGYLLSEVWPVAAVVRAQLFRSSRLLLILALAQIAGGLACAFRTAWQRDPLLTSPQRWLELLSALATLACLALPALLDWLPAALILATLTALISSRLSSVQALFIVLVLALVLAAPGAWHWPATGPFHLPDLPASALLATAAVLAVLTLTRWPRLCGWPALALALTLTALWTPTLLRQRLQPRDDSFTQAALWAQAHTPPDALFLTPPQKDGFRILAQRSPVAEWRDGTQLFFNASFAPTWWTRLRALQPGLLTSEDQRQILSWGPGYEALPDDQLIALAQRFHAGYILLSAGKRTQLVREYANADWAIYQPRLPEEVIPDGVVDKGRWIAAEKFMRETVYPNIERYRKSDVRIRIVDDAGRAVCDLPYHLTETRPAFAFSASLPFFKTPVGESLNDYEPPVVRDVELAAHEKLFNASLIPFSGKWTHIEAKEGERTYDDLDAYVKWAHDRDLTLEFHFVSGYLPIWVRQRPQDQPKLFLEHARALVERYGDKIKYWQVVNEDINLRFAPAVFKAMRELNPNVQLGISACARFETEPRGRRGSSPYVGLQSVRYLKEQGVKVDFFAFHGHAPHGLWADPRDAYAALDAFAHEGVKIHISEFCEPCPAPILGPLRQGLWTPDLQAEYYARILAVCYSHPDVELFNLWSLGRYAWLPGAGLLDVKDQPKPVFYRLEKLLHETWHTEAAGTLPLDGALALRAFHGQYDLQLTLPDQRTATAHFSILPPARTPATATQAATAPAAPPVEIRLQLNAGTGALTLLPRP